MGPVTWDPSSQGSFSELYVVKRSFVMWGFPGKSRPEKSGGFGRAEVRGTRGYMMKSEGGVPVKMAKISGHACAGKSAIADFDERCWRNGDLGKR